MTTSGHRQSAISARPYHPPQDPLRIVYRDDDLLVLSKPSGLLSVPGKHESHADCLEARAKAEFPGALLIHRLDMDTSGLFVMAMNREAQAHLGKQFQRRHVDKTYIARVWGLMVEDSGMVDLPLRCDWPNRPLQMVCHEHGRPAQTGWRVLSRDAATHSTLVELSPETGRSHQLRVHMLELGHPILGDNFYAHEDALNAAPRLMLHAQLLKMFHPADGRRVVFEDEAGF